MIAVPIPHSLIWAFYLKKAFFFYVTPILVGLLVAVLYPLGQRAAQQHANFLRAWGFAALGPTCMLLGWGLVVRSIWTAPMYGLGYGLGSALLSRVHSIRLWPLKIVTRTAAYECEVRARAAELSRRKEEEAACREALTR